MARATITLPQSAACQPVTVSSLAGDTPVKTVHASLPRRQFERGVDRVLPYGGIRAADAVHHKYPPVGPLRPDALIWHRIEC